MTSFVDENREVYRVEPIGQALPIAPSTYHDHVAKREAVAQLRAVMDLSDRRACQIVGADSVDHDLGERAGAALRKATIFIAQLLSARDDDVHFTSGSTHAIEFPISHVIGVAGSRTLRIAPSRVEHSMLIDVAKRAERIGHASTCWLDVSFDAPVDLEDVKRRCWSWIFST